MYDFLGSTGVSALANRIFTDIKNAGFDRSVEMTLEEYNALSEEEKNDGTSRYISDVDIESITNGNIKQY